MQAHLAAVKEKLSHPLHIVLRIVLSYYFPRQRFDLLLWISSRYSRVLRSKQLLDLTKRFCSQNLSDTRQRRHVKR